MHFVILSVLCSVAVSIVLRLTRRFDIDLTQAISVNYLVAAVATLALLHPQPRALLSESAAMQRAWPVYVLLGVLLPAMFWVLGMAVRVTGVARTDAAQRLSLLLPLLAAFTVFGEAWTWQKGAGIGLGLAAMVLLLLRRRAPAEQGPQHPHWLWPLAVFVGMGVIDITFKQLARLSGVDASTSLFAVFVLAVLTCALALAVPRARKRRRTGVRQVLAGVALGLLNFGNIVFYVYAHQSLPGHPALVFSAMNIGVMVLGACVGLWVFRERLNRCNLLGLGAGVVAVLVIATA